MSWKNKIKRALELLWFFVKIGTFTFGGGWSILAQMQKEFVEKRAWIDEEELIDITSIGRSLPGIMITNIAAIFGYHLGGIICAVAAVIGISIPSIVAIGIVTMFYQAFRDNIYVARVLVGIRAAVVPIIASAALKLRKTALRDATGYILGAVAVVLCLFTSLNKIFIVIMGAVAGLLIMEVRNRGTV